MTDTTKLLDDMARELARQAGYDPDETWQEFDRDAHHSHAVVGESYEDPTITRWHLYLNHAVVLSELIGLPILLAKSDRADALEAELAALKARIEGLVARWYKTGDEAAKVASTVGDDLAEKIVKLVNDARDQCANELAALLPADGED